MRNVSHGPTATTSALRGCAVTSACSPKNAPSVSSASCLPLAMTMTVPDTSTKKSCRSTAPWVMMNSPSSKLTGFSFFESVAN